MANNKMLTVRKWFCCNAALFVSIVAALASIDASPAAMAENSLSFEGANNSLTSYLCDTELLQSVANQVQLLNAANENLKLNFDVLSMKLEHDATLKQSELLKSMRDLLATPHSSSVPTTSKTSTKTLPPATSCAEAVARDGQNKSGLYQLYLPHTKITEPFFAYCLLDPAHGPAWTVIQRRIDGAVDFFRDWKEYKYGFGNIYGEHFMGLKKLHAMTTSQLHELWIELVDFSNETRFAKYSSFAIGGGHDSDYALQLLGEYSGSAGDSLRRHQGHKFSTKDADNDIWLSSCANSFQGAWWYSNCHHSNLNGQYLRGEYPKESHGRGIDWNTWHGHQYSLKYVHMAIRPINFKP